MEVEKRSRERSIERKGRSTENCARGRERKRTKDGRGK